MTGLGECKYYKLIFYINKNRLKSIDKTQQYNYNTIAMLINIMKAKAEEGVKHSFNAELKINSDYRADIISPVTIKGEFEYKNEVLYLSAVASCKLRCICDSCGEKFERDFQFDINEKFLESYNSHSEEDYIINQAGISIDKAVIDNLLLSLPSKIVCKEDCKGLCPICGKNKNFLSCNCKVD